MSYEYKDDINMMIFANPGKDLMKSFKMRDEIDHVYAQAAKADEYEKNKYRTHVNDRKAEAFDAILKSYDEAFSREHMADDVSNIIEKYESGESEIK